MISIAFLSRFKTKSVISAIIMRRMNTRSTVCSTTEYPAPSPVLCNASDRWYKLILAHAVVVCKGLMNIVNIIGYLLHCGLLLHEPITNFLTNHSGTVIGSWFIDHSINIYNLRGMDEPLHNRLWNYALRYDVHLVTVTIGLLLCPQIEQFFT